VRQRTTIRKVKVLQPAARGVISFLAHVNDDRKIKLMEVGKKINQYSAVENHLKSYDAQNAAGGANMMLALGNDDHV